MQCRATQTCRPKGRSCIIEFVNPCLNVFERNRRSMAVVKRGKSRVRTRNIPHSAIPADSANRLSRDRLREIRTRVGRSTRSPVEIPLACPRRVLEYADVRCRGHSGRDVLDVSFSAHDPQPTWLPRTLASVNICGDRSVCSLDCLHLQSMRVSSDQGTSHDRCVATRAVPQGACLRASFQHPRACSIE